MTALSTLTGRPAGARPHTAVGAPTVSVIVPTFNRPDRLAHALESLARQEGVEVEAIVVNDAGRDVTPVVDRARRTLHVELIDQPTNMGLATARNTGIEVASGEYTALLDDDDVFRKRHLRSLIDVMERKGADIAYGDCPVSTELLDVHTATQERVDQIRYVFDYPYDDRALLVTNIIPVIAPVIRSLQDTGARFDPELPVQEDWDMFLQLQHLGMRFVHEPQRSVVYHRIPNAVQMTTNLKEAGGSNAQFRATYRRLMEKWPVAQGSPADEYRGWMTAAYELAGKRLAEGEAVSHFFYERVLRVIYDALTGVSNPARLKADLAIAIADDEEAPIV